MKTLPIAQHTRLQALLDEGDRRFFATHPREGERRRFHFRGEQIDGAGEPSRYVVVTRDPDGRLLRRFEQNGGEV